MNEVLARWNELDSSEAAKGILPCCGAKAWAEGLAGKRPFEDEAAVLITSDEIWRGLGTSDWLGAFESQPEIGEVRPAVPNERRSKVTRRLANRAPQRRLEAIRQPGRSRSRKVSWPRKTS